EIWGHVYFNSMSTPLTGATLMELIPSPGVFDISDSSGYYHQFVSPDTYALQALYPGGMSVSYMDYYTGTSGAAPWSGTVASGMSRHVDFILKLDNREFSIIAGQVLDYTTHTPITGFEVKAYNSAQLFPATMVDTFGHFMFSPISDFSTDWMVDGYSPVHAVSLVEYDFLSSWTPMTAAGLPITFTHSPMTVMWVNIYVNQSEPPSERTKLWGKVFLDDFGGLEVSGVVVMEHLVSPGIFDVTDTTGTYSKVVTSGLTYELDISYPTAYSIRYYDHQTGITGVGSWSDVVTSVSRRVDFAFKLRTKEYAEILGQVTLESDGSPVPGFSITAENLGGSTYPPQSTGPGGMFEFNPVADLSSDWIIDGSHPGYSVVSVEYHLIGGTTTTATSLPVDFPLSSMDIMWVDISVNQTDICNGTVFGKVYKLYNYDPAAGAQATIYNAATPFTPMDAQTLGTNGLYTFTVPAGIYIVKISLSGYSTESAEVTVVCDEETYHPFYLIPRPIGPWNVVSIKFVMNETGEPLSGSWVEVSGLGRLKTDEAGDIHLKIPGPTNLTINLKSFVVVASNDDNGKEIPTNDDGTVTLEPGRSYTNRVVKFRPGSELATNVKSESPEVSTLGLIGIVAAALVIGGAAGFLARGSRKTDIEE
ncbi:MAG: carboxypeptidase-like regulatory domain-containing protein, partial [Candidatus Thermoplasmatota archaeon]|nr:carboxypeptidase-like regulatory domain-containing protein [Candidatus Thermoplasmatota archaeon]